MASEDRSPIDRRTYLKLAGSAAAGATLAGCTDGGDQPTATPEETEEPMETEEPEATEEPTEEADDEDFVVTITQGNMDAGLDPHDHAETNTTIILVQAYETIIQRDAEGTIGSLVAEDYELVQDDTVRFSLRDDVTFHNGDDMTPEDVAFSFNRMVDDETGGLASPQSGDFGNLEVVEVVDGENAVDFVSDGPNPALIASVAGTGDIMQQSWVEERDTEAINSEANGTGPFQLDEYVQDEEVVYSAYEDYWGGRAEIDGVVFNASTESSTRVNQLVNGESDIVENVPPQEVSRIEDSGEARVEAVASTRVIFNGMRTDKEPFESREFRQAMNYAIDLESIIENVLSGFSDPTGQPTLEGFFGHDPEIDPYPYDPEQAEELVDESGYADAEITLHSPVGRYLKDLEIAQAVAGYIDELPNVSASVQQRDFGTLAGELTSGSIEDKPDFFLIGWGNETFDASQTLIPLLTSGGVLTVWTSDEFDELVDQSQRETDEDAREQLLHDANALAHDEAPWIFLNRQYSVYGVSERLDWQARADETIKAYDITPN